MVVKTEMVTERYLRHYKREEQSGPEQNGPEQNGGDSNAGQTGSGSGGGA